MIATHAGAGRGRYFFSACVTAVRDVIIVTGIYVHLPFCPYICPYCDFAKWPMRRSSAQRYFAALQHGDHTRTAVYGADDLSRRRHAEHVRPGGHRRLDRRLRERVRSRGRNQHRSQSRTRAATTIAPRTRRGHRRISIGVQSLDPNGDRDARAQAHRWRTYGGPSMRRARSRDPLGVAGFDVCGARSDARLVAADACAGLALDGAGPHLDLRTDR